MTQRNIASVEVSSIYLSITKTPSGEYRISSGDTPNFLPDKTIIISDSNPNLLWDLVHELMGIPLPRLNSPKVIEPETVEEPVQPEKAIDVPTEAPSDPIFTHQMNELEEQLSRMSAAEIIAKVLNETGVQITINLKSKKPIVKKALSIYNER